MLNRALADFFFLLLQFVRVPRGEGTTAVFDINRATKATAGPEPQIENGGMVGCKGGLVWPGGVWFVLGQARGFKSKISLCWSECSMSSPLLSLRAVQ